MPKLWHDTIEAHRNAVADAIMDHTAALASTEGLHTLTMARIAQETGIGRATLYRHFKDVEEILSAWHRRQISIHLADLEAARQAASDPVRALEAVLVTYARHGAHDHHGGLGRVLHAMPHAHEAHHHLQRFVADIIRECVAAGRMDAASSPDERAAYTLAALQAAPSGASKMAVSRLVGMILRGLGTSAAH